MQSDHIGKSNWDGTLPARIMEYERTYWEVFPAIRIRLLHKFVQLLGAAKQPPSPELIGKALLVADTKGNMQSWLGMPGRALLNDWGCYCQKFHDSIGIFHSAGTEKQVGLQFVIDWDSPLKFVSMRVDAKSDPAATELLHKVEQSFIHSSFDRIDWTRPEYAVSVHTYKPGPWESGLEVSFKASIWILANKAEALAEIWGLRE